jgi:hypothetical protein
MEPMRRIQVLLWMVLAVLFGLGQAAALAAYPMRTAVIAEGALAEIADPAPPCHQGGKSERAPDQPAKGHVGLCLCALSCHAMTPAPETVGIAALWAPTPAFAPPPPAWANAPAGLDPPVPKALA